MGETAMKLTQMNKDTIDELIRDLLTERVGAYDNFNYIIVDDETIFIKFWTIRPRSHPVKIVMSIKAKLSDDGKKLEIVEVS